MPFSTYRRNLIMTSFRGAAIYVELFDADPTVAGTGGNKLTTDIVGSAVRPQITWGAVQDQSGGRGIAQSGEFEYKDQAANASNVTAKYIGYFDADDGGNFEGYERLKKNGVDFDFVIQNGDRVYFEDGELQVSTT